MNKPVLWEELTWKEIDELRKKLDMVILPIGSTEQHGPHLPLNVDILVPYEVAKRVSAETGVPVLPPIVYGASRTHKRFPGSIWVSSETLYRIFVDICKCLYAQGFKKILAINGHGTNIWPLKSAWDTLRFELPDIQIKVISWWEFLEESMQKRVFEDGDHANTMETSITLYLRPDLVHMDRAVDEPMIRCLFDYRVDQRSKSGVVGKPSLASAEYGETLIKTVCKAAIKFVKEALKEKIPYP